jgi:phytoene dehydrogenase-like protein
VETVVLDDGRRFEIPVGIDAYRSALHKALPDERDAIDRYLMLMVGLDKHVNALSTVPGPAGLPGPLRHFMPLVRYRNTTLGDIFDWLQLSPMARLLLSETSGFYGLPPSLAPVALHALYITARVRGSWYPSGGGPSIAGGLAEVVTAHGGELLLGHEVTRIEVRGGAVSGVEVRDTDGTRRQMGAAVVVSKR